MTLGSSFSLLRTKVHIFLYITSKCYEKSFRIQVSSFKFQVSGFKAAELRVSRQQSCWFQVSSFKFQDSSFKFQISGFFDERSDKVDYRVAFAD